MRQYLGDEIYLAVRTPAQWRTLRSEKKFRQKKYAHLALFDDGILGSMTHLGTFGTELREAAGWAQAWTRKEEMEFVNCLTEDGKEGFKAVHEDLVNGDKSCMAGFVLKNTLSDNGGVTRGICKMDTENVSVEIIDFSNEAQLNMYTKKELIGLV